MNPDAIREVNEIDICLILKVNKLEFINQIMHISLCNVTYKLLTKIVVHRLKVVVSKIDSLYRNGFIPGRNISKNIFTAQEMSHTMEKMRSKVCFYAIKLDLAKAYDKMWRSLIK